MATRIEEELGRGARPWRNRRPLLRLWPWRIRTRARPDRSPDQEPITSSSPLARLLCCVLIISSPSVQAKEAVIFEQIGQHAGVTANLHVQVELSISSVEGQLDKYRQLLKKNCDTEMAVLNYMLAYVNTTISNFTLRKEYPEKPEDFS